MEPDYEIVPNHSAFVNYRLFWMFIIFAVIATGIITALSQVIQPMPILAVFGAVFILFAWNRQAKYKKTRLSFFDDKIVYTTGSLVSDSKTTLTIKNITHLKHKRPWLENKIFNTSIIGIECAGSGGTEAHIKSVPYGEEIYDYAQECMKANGFKLEKKKLLQEEKPKKSAVIFKNIGIGGIVLLSVGGPAFLSALLTLAVAPLAFLAIFLGAALFLSLFALHVMNLIKRVYYVYDDCLEYKEGFLTKEDSIIPAENLADSHNTQNLLDRVFGVSNLVISTQGTGGISFSNMPNGERLEDTIDKMARAYKPLIGESSEEPEEGVKKIEKSAPKESRTGYTGEFKMNFFRAIAQSLFIIIIGVVLIFSVAFVGLVDEAFLLEALVGSIYVILFAVIFVVRPFLNAKFTKYEVRKKGIHEKYEFIRRTTHEFTDDKLVGMVVNRNPLDRLFNTASITFQSLSTSPNVTFKHIKDYGELLGNLKEKYYLDTPRVKTIEADYKVRYALCRHLLVLLPVFAVIAAFFFIVPEVAYSLIAVLIAGALLKHLTFKHSKLEMCREHLRHTVGYFFTKTTLVRYEDVKNQASTSYKLTPVGGLYFGVGGQNVADDNNMQMQGGGVVTGNGFTADYLPGTDSLLDEIDQIVTGHSAGKTLTSAQRSMKNPSLVHLLLLIFPPSILALPITLWRVSKFSYELQETRVVEYHGVWNKVKRTVVYPNIDHVSVKRGVTNKMSGNGSINIYTLGSSKEDLAVRNVGEYEKWHEEIERRYK